MNTTIKRRIAKLESLSGSLKETELSAAFRRAKGTALRPKLQGAVIDEPDFSAWIPTGERN